MQSVKLWGYTIYDNGIIEGIYGKKMRQTKQIKINWGLEKKPRFVSYARFVYYAFNQNSFDFEDMSISIKHKDNDKSNNSINNLIKIDKKSYIHGEYHSMAKLSNKDVNDIKYEYEHNGHSYRSLANIYGVSHTTIRGIVKGFSRNESNYKL